MSRLSYRTIGGENPQRKPKVYFSCHPDDIRLFFDEYCTKILRITDCAVWYESEPEAEYDKEDLELNLSQMQLFVMPVTTKLLTTPNRAMDFEFRIAKDRHIPVLPIMMERGLDGIYSECFGNLQYLDPNNRDETRRSFAEVLETYIKSVLVSDELAAKIRAAFDAYIFLSYRKKDRKKAQELMRLIHGNPLCLSIAIWYDEFLNPGEDFNHAISEMIRKCDLFTIVVTPNIVNEDNYVMNTEYPAALEQGKPILPVEMEKTDYDSLKEHFKSFPPCVRGENSNAFHPALLEKLKSIAVTADDAEPGHKFLIGLAYLDGIDVEVDAGRAVELITEAAETGLPEAMKQLAVMYETGKGVSPDFRKAVRWREKHAAYLRKAYNAEPTKERAEELIYGLLALADAQYEIRALDDAGDAYEEVHNLAGQYVEPGKYNFLMFQSDACRGLGKISMAENDIAGAQIYYEKSLSIQRKTAEETGLIESADEAAIGLGELGRLAMARKDYAGAKEYYKAALAIREDIPEEARTVWMRRNLAVNCDNLGDIEKEEGNNEGARKYYERAFAIFKDLSEKTGTFESRADLAVCYGRLGELAEESGDFARAQSFYEKGHAISEELAAKTGTVMSRRSLSVSYNQLGTLAKLRGNLALAQEYYEKGLAIREKLDKETGTQESGSDLAVSYFHLGDLAVKRGDTAGAEKFYEKGLAIQQKLAIESGDAEAEHELSFGYLHLGDEAMSRGDYMAAAAFYEKILPICEKTNAQEYRRVQALALEGLGKTAEAGKDIPAAQKYFERSLLVFKQLCEQTGTPMAYKDLAISYDNLGRFFYDNNVSKLKSKVMFERVLKLRRVCGSECLGGLDQRAEDLLNRFF